MSRLKEIAARLHAADKAPWTAGYTPEDDEEGQFFILGSEHVFFARIPFAERWRANVVLMRAAPEDLEWLLGRVRALEAENARLRTICGILQQERSE